MGLSQVLLAIIAGPEKPNLLGFFYAVSKGVFVLNTEFFKEKSAGILISLFVFALYSWVSWLVSGEGTWWIIDIINSFNVYFL